MNAGGKAGTPGQFRGAPHIFQMAQAVVRLIGGEDHRIDRADLLGQALNAHLIVAVGGFRGQFGGGLDLLDLAHHGAKGQGPVLRHGQLLVVVRGLCQDVVGVTLRLKEGPGAGIGGGAGLAPVCDLNRHAVLIGDPVQPGQLVQIADLHRENDAGNVGALRVNVVGAAHQGARAGLIQRGGGDGIHRYLVPQLCGVKVRVGDVHQNVAGKLHRLLGGGLGQGLLRSGLDRDRRAGGGGDRVHLIRAVGLNDLRRHAGVAPPAVHGPVCIRLVFFVQNAVLGERHRRHLALRNGHIHFNVIGVKVQIFVRLDCGRALISAVLILGRPLCRKAGDCAGAQQHRQGKPRSQPFFQFHRNAPFFSPSPAVFRPRLL